MGVGGSSRVMGFVTAAGTGRWLGEIASGINKHRIPKPLVPIGSRRIVDFAIDSLHRIGVRDVYVNYRKETEAVRGYLENVSVFYRPTTMQYRLETKLMGSLGSFVNMARFCDLKEDDIAVVLHGDIVQTLDIDPVIAAHMRSRADATLVVKPVWGAERARLKNCETISLPGMPNMMEEAQEPGLRKVLDDLRASGGTAWVRRYNRREPLGRAYSNLIDASVYVFSGKFVLDYIAGKITERPTPKDEGRIARDIEALEAAYRVIKERFPLKSNPTEDEIKAALSEQGMLHGDMAKAIEKLHEQSKQEFGSSFYNCEHAFFRAVADNKKVLAFLMPEDCYWRDVGNRYEVWESNMDVLGNHMALLKLDEGAERKLWERTEWGWKSTKNVRVPPGAKLKFPTIVCDNSSIEEGVEIENSVIGEGAVVHKGAKIRSSVIFPRIAGEGAADNEVFGGVTLENCMFLGGIVRTPGHYKWMTFFVPEGDIIRNEFGA